MFEHSGLTCAHHDVFEHLGMMCAQIRSCLSHMTSELPCFISMERFLSLGWEVMPKVEAPQPKARGGPKATAVEGGLDLGEKRPRVCGSKKVVIDEQRWKEMETCLELLETVHAQGHVPGEEVETVLSLHAAAEEENKQLMGPC